MATLLYTGGRVNSNITTGELLENVTVTKTAISQSYAPGYTVAYVVNIINSGSAPVTGFTVVDDLGAYEYDGATVYPLEYIDGSVLCFSNGALDTAPTAVAGPPLTFSGVTVPAFGNVSLIYSASVTQFAPLGGAAQITNTVTVSGGSVITPITASATLPAEAVAELTIAKSVCPQVVTGAEPVTYTFILQNSGSEADAAAALSVTDTFDPILKGLTAELNGAAFTAYTYDEATGLFESTPGAITVPAATYAQEKSGGWAATPGVTVLTVTGTI